MQLKMDRSEKSGFFGKKYALFAHLVISDEERALLKRHKLQDAVLFDAEEEWDLDHGFQVTAGGYITKGHTFSCRNVNELAILENRLEENCRTLAKTLKSLDGAFDGGPRTVSFDEDD
ncbi:MAG: hypothetical protein M3177_01150 [Pseudomonadota bacterium]|nr:hypothetical protein [Pseudomonadota bacterium]